MLNFFMTRLLITFILATFFVSTAWAVKMTSLYQAEVPVMTQTDADREQAIKQGLIQVLIKVSGDFAIDKNPVIKSNLKRAAYFVQEYSYQPTNDSQYILQIRFSKSDIATLLKKVKITTAPLNEERPLTLVWLVYSKGEQSEIIGNESPGNLLTIMKQRGKSYGLPLIFPMMDMTDMDKVTVLDVHKPDISLLQAAGKRYAPDALLIGRIDESDNMFRSEWQLVLGGNQWNWIISNEKIDNIIATVLSQVSQTLAKQYVEKIVSPSSLLELEVANVKERDDLINLMDYLKKLTQVKQVELAQVSGDTVSLSVEVQGSMSNFEQNPTMNQHLILKSQDTTKNKLVYEWVH